jgi:DNA-binding HxlR family transcriptional regulator
VIELSLPNDKVKFDSLTRRGYSLPILKFLTTESENITFGKIMEKLNISKRGLSLTLNDLESDGLIERSKIGRQSFVSITLKGRVVTESLPLRKKNSEIIEEALDATVRRLEDEGIISPDWNTNDREEFIEKLKISITEQINKVERL